MRGPTANPKVSAMSLARRPAVRLFLAMALATGALGSAHAQAASGDERVWLTKADIQSQLIGHGVLSRNLASGKLSHWEFHADGRVEAVSKNGLGSASGTWTLRDDGQMCVNMLGRSGCRYWFRSGKDFANADTRAPDAQTVAEVRYD